MMNEPANQLAEFRQRHEQLKASLGSVVLGQDQVIEQLLITLFAEGHALLIGVPGLAKTLLVKTLAGALGWHSNRIQFTPDLMPSDITGTEILQTDPTTGERHFKFVHGPIFSNLILADEINRTPPKTQAALLEAMQERSVTAGGQTMLLPKPFAVIATQNPIEHEGTYPLPEAQLDRFMFCINVGYPDKNAEMQIVEATTAGGLPEITPLFGAGEVQALQAFIRQVPVSKYVLDYAVSLVRASRPKERGAPSFVTDFVEWGAGLRASQYLVLAAKVKAVMEGRPAPFADDIRAVAHPVLRHRIVPNYQASGQGIDAEAIIDKLIEIVPEPNAAD